MLSILVLVNSYNVLLADSEGFSLKLLRTTRECFATSMLELYAVLAYRSYITKHNNHFIMVMMILKNFTVSIKKIKLRLLNF